jgi:hypothetical protein
MKNKTDLQDMHLKVKKYERDQDNERQLEEYRRMQLKLMVHQDLAETSNFKSSLKRNNILEDIKLAFRFGDVSLPQFKFYCIGACN